mmetsp:Transcript_65197/g.105414  ORF Transcript_65197/g.105414 Transcript_65197/m.105414 type:complete len:318 (-) Transcript_65197:65-1018(-)
MSMPVSAGCPRPGFRSFVALAAFVLLSVTWMVRQMANPEQSAGAFGGSLQSVDRALVELALERYKSLSRNVTARVGAAEKALQELQRRQAEVQKQTLAQQKAQSQLAPQPPQQPQEEKAGSGVAEDPDGGDQGADDEPEETDEERAKRQEAEEQEQRSLIHYEESSKKFRRWRGDYKCGDRVPLLPDAEAVECEPGFAAPCCSALGWCGRSAAHCSCEMCTDYRSKVQISFQSVKLVSEFRECETIAEHLGELEPEACARKAMETPQCGRNIMYSKDYPHWGCRCCALDTPAGDAEKPSWNVYEYQVAVEPLAQDAS